MDDAGSRDETLRRVERHVRVFFFRTMFKIGALINNASLGLNVARRLPPHGRGPITLRDSKDRKFPYMVLTSRSSLRTGRMASSHNPLLRTIDISGISRAVYKSNDFTSCTHIRVSSLHHLLSCCILTPLVLLCSSYQCSCNHAVLLSSLVLCVYLFSVWVLAVVFLIHRLFPRNCACLSYFWGISPLFPNPIPLVKS